MKILFLSYFYEPDLSAGSFRSTALSRKLAELPGVEDIHIVTTEPNRYSTFKTKVDKPSGNSKIRISRIAVPVHKNGLIDQIWSFYMYYRGVKRYTKGASYDIVYATSSKLFTAYLGSRIAKNRKIPLYLDIRDVFLESIGDLLKGKFTTPLLIWMLGYFERRTFSKATHINLVSEGFKSYFKKYTSPSYTYFTNGIDDEFLGLPATKFKPNNPRVITYAGNIGEGQGLHIFVPAAAKALEGEVIFNIIGDGGAKKKLEQAIAIQEVKNVHLHSPVKRKELIEIYLKSDFLFLHLNDFEAFKKVLPSKLFEYGALDKPIIAGVSGYASRFISDYLDNVILFNPGDYIDFLEKYSRYNYVNKERVDFKQQFERNIIMSRMAESIINLNS